MTVETYVAVAFDVEQEAVWVWPPVPHYGVVAVVCSDGLQNIPLLLCGQRRGLFRRHRKLSLRHDLRLAKFPPSATGGRDPCG